LALVFALVAAPAGRAAAPADGDAGTAAIEACLRGNLPSRSSVQHIRFETTDRMGGSRKLAGTVYWKRGEDDLSRSLIRVESPPDLRGSAYLLIEHGDDVDVFVYLPDYQRVRRITSRSLSGSLFGTDFSYEDMRRLRHVLEAARAERLPDALVEGRNTHVLRLVPPAESSYGEVRAWVDAETCVPLKMELYARGGELAKVLTTDASTLTRQGPLWVAHAFRLRDLQEGTETRLELGELQVDVDVPDRLFSERTLTQGR